MSLTAGPHQWSLIYLAGRYMLLLIICLPPSSTLSQASCEPWRWRLQLGQRYCRTCRRWATSSRASKQAWIAIAAPRKTPAEIIKKLKKEINAGLADPKMKARLAELGGKP